MSHATAEIELISLDDAYVLMDDGEVLPVTGWYDNDGDDCEPAEAVTFVAGRDGYGWITGTIGERVAQQ